MSSSTRRAARALAARAFAPSASTSATTFATTTRDECARRMRATMSMSMTSPTRAMATNAKPSSLERATDADDDAASIDAVPRASASGWRRMALALGGYFSSESRHVRGGERLYAEVTRATDACDALYDGADALERTFATRHAVVCLHVWMCLGRLRKEGEDGKDFSQIFYDAFQDDVERRVHAEGVRVRVRKWLQDLERTFYGNAVSYDKALELGGGELVKALHRNVFDGQGDEKRAKFLERYVRHQLASLALTPSQAVMEGRITFAPFERQQQ